MSRDVAERAVAKAYEEVLAPVDVGAWNLRDAVLDSLGIVARKPQRAAPAARLGVPETAS
ncbi:MAG: hypothetical protein PHU43_09820 [Candidatus Bipolaricaulis sp.]|nr:hypothetical protein [Candidatus Bipolaricaulis sp.]